MKRAPIVLTGTACGLVAVIGYHAASPHASALASSSSAGPGASTLNVGGSSSASGTSQTSTTRAATIRSATGSDVQFQYGDIEVKVTMKGSRLTDVSIVKANVSDQHSYEINQYAIPQLRSQALSAQSAHIDGISGASYTSAAYEQSLQAAIDKLNA